MGGLGPGYEQAIQVLVFEIVRDHIDKPLPEPGTSRDGWADETVHRVNDWPGCGFSGAQVGAAKWLAYRFLSRGHRRVLDELRAHDKDRLTQVSRTWPHEPESVRVGEPVPDTPAPRAAENVAGGDGTPQP